MKICPLITQTSLLDETENDLLLREADSSDLDENENERQQDESEGKDIFMNPDVESTEQETGEGESAENRPIRFLAKSFHGEVVCLGELCRFYDEKNNTCRFENLMEQIARSDDDRKNDLESITPKIEKVWEFQQKSTGDILAFFKDQEEKIDHTHKTLKENFEKRLEKLTELVSSLKEDNKGIIKGISDTFAEKTEKIEEKMESGEKNLENFKTEISAWKDVLDKNMDSMHSGFEDNKKLVNELSENNSEIVKMVENQKKSLEKEERKRQLSEAKRINNAGVIAYHNGQYKKALEMFKKALEIDPEFTEGYNNLGLTYTEINEEDKATEAFKKAIELNPDLAATYNNLGYVFYRLGSFEEAIEMYNEAIGRSKDSSSAYTNMGNACYKLDRIEDAIEAWKKAVEIDPGNEKARRNLKRFNAEVQQENS